MISENIFLATLLWAGVYQLCLEYIKDEVKASRVFSSIHGITTFIGALGSLVVSQKFPEMLGIYTDAFVSIPIGYAIIDTLSMLIPEVYNTTPQFTIPHHIALVVSLYTQRSVYSSLIAMGLLSEITNPVLNSALIVRGEEGSTISKENSKKLFRIGCVLVPLFFIFRVLNFTYLSYITIKDRSLISVPTILLTILNYYWFGKILSHTKKYV